MDSIGVSVVFEKTVHSDEWSVTESVKGARVKLEAIKVDCIDRCDFLLF